MGVPQDPLSWEYDGNMLCNHNYNYGGTPKIDGVCSGKSHSKMDDLHAVPPCMEAPKWAYTVYCSPIFMKCHDTIEIMKIH